MVTKPCKRCGTEIEFKVGISRSVGKQPFRSHATCPACGAKHYVMVENRELYAMYDDDEERD